MTMMVLVPTRGRSEEQLRECFESFRDTKTLLGTGFQFILDPDSQPYPEDIPQWHCTLPTGNMRAALNQAAMEIASTHEYDVLGFIGDDHRFRSKGWDAAIEHALQDGGIAYGDDGVQGEALPTQWFVTSDIVRALGWFALPECNHFYLDNAWLDLANAAGCKHYLPEVKIEHLHFSYGKSSYDATYEHTMSVGGGDQTRYKWWRNSDNFQIDSYKVIGALQERQKNV